MYLNIIVLLIMNAVVSASINTWILLSLWSICNGKDSNNNNNYTDLTVSPSGAFISPNGYTLTGVMSVNGSDPNGGCSTDCVGVVSGIKRCDCMDTRRLDSLLMG